MIFQGHRHDDGDTSPFEDDDGVKGFGASTATGTDTDDEGVGPCGCCASSVSPIWAGAALLILFCFGAMTILGVVKAPELFALESNVNYAPAADSPSAIAGRRLWKEFDFLAAAADSEVVMVIRSLDGRTSLINGDVRIFSEKVAASISSDIRTAPYAPVVSGYFLGSNDVHLAPQDSILEYGFISSDETLMLILFMLKNPMPVGSAVSPWEVRDQALSLVHELAADPPRGTEVLVTGNPVTSQDAALDQSVHLMLLAEVAVTPIAFLVLTSLVRHMRLLLLPVVALGVTFLFATAIVVPVVEAQQKFSTDIIAGMVSVTIALSLDYNLFILTRFKDNLAAGLTLQRNVAVILSTSAHTVCISGLLIAVAFFGAWAIPEANLQEAGLCMGLTTIACMIVNGLLTPSLLLLFGRPLTMPCCRPCSTRRRRPTERSLEVASLRGQPWRTRAQRECCDSWWLRLMYSVEACPQACVVVLLLLFAPVIMQVLQLRASADAYELLPQDLPSVRAIQLMDEKGIPPGRFEPYTLVVNWRKEKDVSGWSTLEFKPGQKSAMLCQYAFEVLLNLCDRALAAGHVSGMLGPTWIMNERVDWQYAHTLQLLTPPNPHWQKLRPVYAAVLQTHVTPQFAVVQVHTDIPARGDTAAEWVEKMRRVIAEWEEAHPQFEATMAGGACEAVDTRDAVMGSMAGYVGITAIGVMVLVFCMFRSLMLTLRLAFALVFTLGATFGFAVLVFQTPLLHPWFPSLAKYNGLTYESVPIPTCIAIALGLDYDIFLITRIVEFRTQGFSDRDSIVYGVAKTGNVITGAGLIMALAFSGFAFSPKVMHQQFALLLITSVVLDTFVVRTVLVPAMMLSAGEWNWWPRRMPRVTRVGLVSDGSETAVEMAVDSGTCTEFGDTATEFGAHSADESN